MIKPTEVMRLRSALGAARIEGGHAAHGAGGVVDHDDEAVEFVMGRDPAFPSGRVTETKLSMAW